MVALAQVVGTEEPEEADSEVAWQTSGMAKVRIASCWFVAGDEKELSKLVNPDEVIWAVKQYSIWATAELVHSLACLQDED